ncbi:MAG: sensor histidine kinase [Vulcanimicrobiaceae bacterium]
MAVRRLPGEAEPQLGDDRRRRATNLEATMLALRDAREAYDVLAIVARGLGRDFQRPCVAYELRERMLRPVAASEVSHVREPFASELLETDRLRRDVLVHEGERDLLGISADGQLRAVFALEGPARPLDEEDRKYLRALASHVSLALSNAFAFDQLRRYAAEGAALAGAARTLLGYTELGPLAGALCNLAVRLFAADGAALYDRRAEHFERIGSARKATALELPPSLPSDEPAAHGRLNAAAPERVIEIARVPEAGGGDENFRGLLAIERRSPIERSDQRLLDALVSLAALAIRNVDLYEQSTRANRALAESNAFKDDLMAMFAHDFKGPLTVISGFAELLAENGDPEVRQYVATIYEQTHRLARLSEDALALAATQSAGFSLQRRLEDLAEFVREAVEPLDPSGERIAVRVPQEPIEVSFDRSRLRHVLDNVVGNAVKYSEGAIEIALEADAQEARIAVIDRGIGIPSAEYERIFARFGRASNARARGVAGSGVGLYIARKIIEVHGGRIEVASREGEGSTFTIALPRSGDAVSAPG